MSDLVNDLSYDDIAEVYDNLTEPQQKHIEQLLDDNEFVDAVYMARWYDKQNSGEWINDIINLNKEPQDGENFNA